MGEQLAKTENLPTKPSTSPAISRAGETELADLHGLFARYLKDRLASGDVKPAELSVIRQFLKDNGIECIGEMNNDMLDLAGELPKFDGDDVIGVAETNAKEHDFDNVVALREAIG